MNGWEGLTYAAQIAAGATIYIDRGDDPVLPVDGAPFAIDHVGAGREEATIVAASAEAITFAIGDTQWMMAPASEAASRLERHGRVLQAWMVTDPTAGGLLPNA